MPLTSLFDDVSVSRWQLLVQTGRIGLGFGLLGGLSGLLGAKTNALVATPATAEGPFFVEESLVRANLVVDAGLRQSVASAYPLVLDLQVIDLSGNPVAGRLVDVWQADAIGVYSDIDDAASQSENTQGRTFLRGRQTTGVDGRVRFETVWPGWTPDRTPHVPFKIRKSEADAGLTSQLFFPEPWNARVLAKTVYAHGLQPVRNANDAVYAAQGTSLLAAVSPNPYGQGAWASFAIVVAA